jgi:hypothetical protein
MSDLSNDASITKLWRIRKTVFEMLNDRKYVVSAAELKRTKDEARWQVARRLEHC